MHTTEIKEKLHQLINKAPAKELQAIYTFIEKNKNAEIVTYPKVLKQELQKRQADYFNRTSKLISARQSKKRIQKILAVNLNGS